MHVSEAHRSRHPHADAIGSDYAAAEGQDPRRSAAVHRAFHASTLIIRFGGGAMADPVLKEGFARDVALLRLVGMNPIIVHGGGWRIDELLQTMGIAIRRQSGMRVTDEATLNVIEMVLGEINQELVGLINRFGAKAVGLSGQDGRFIHARRMTLPPDGRSGEAPDLGLVGEVESIDPDVIHLLSRAASFRSSCPSAWARTAPPITSTPTASPDSSRGRCTRKS